MHYCSNFFEANLMLTAYCSNFSRRYCYCYLSNFFLLMHKGLLGTYILKDDNILHLVFVHQTQALEIFAVPKALIIYAGYGKQQLVIFFLSSKGCYIGKQSIVQYLLFPKMVDCLLVLLEKNKQTMNYFPTYCKLYMIHQRFSLPGSILDDQGQR